MPRKKSEVRLYDAVTRLPEGDYLKLVEQARENERSIASELRIAVRKHLKAAA